MLTLGCCAYFDCSPEEFIVRIENSISVHEAAHALCAWAAGLRVDQVKLFGCEGGGEVTMADRRVPTEKLPDLAIVAMAGGMAEIRYLTDLGVPSGLAEKWVDSCTAWDQATVDLYLKRCDMSRWEMQARAQIFLNAKWPVVLRLGSILYTRKKLSGSSSNL